MDKLDPNLIALLRKTIPNEIAKEIVSVQPMPPLPEGAWEEMGRTLAAMAASRTKNGERPCCIMGVHVPNQTSLDAIAESEAGLGAKYGSVSEMLEDLD